MYCASCGTKLPENARFCPSCGMKVAQTETASKPKKWTPEAIDELKQRMDAPIPEKIKDQVIEDLADAMIKALERADPSYFNVKASEDSAEFIHNELIEKEVGYTKLSMFLYRLAQQWPAYKEVADKWIQMKR